MSLWRKLQFLPGRVAGKLVKRAANAPSASAVPDAADLLAALRHSRRRAQTSGRNVAERSQFRHLPFCAGRSTSLVQNFKPSLVRREIKVKESMR